MNNTIDNVITSAERFRASVNVSPRNFVQRIAEIRYADYLGHQIENPTRANIAMNKVYKEHPVIFPMTYESNMAHLESIPKIDTLITTLGEKYNKLYPKTGGLRERLIKADRVVFDKVKPALKGLRKQLLKLRVLF